jgi:hypothetical protein
VGEVFSHRQDPSFPDGDICPVPAVPGTINDSTVFDDDVGLMLCCGGDAGQQQGKE